MKLLSSVLAIFLISLIAYQGLSQSVSIEVPSNPLRSIAHARIFFNRVKASNVLLKTATQEGEYSLFTFEDSDTVIRAHKSIIIYFELNKATWKASVTYYDSTRQEIPYLGENGISTVNVNVNPYDIAPLVAVLDFTLTVPGKIRLTIVGRDSGSINYTNTFTEVALSHPKVPVFGLYEDYLNTVVISVLSPSGSFRFEEVVTIQTDAFPEFARMNVSKSAYKDNKNHFILTKENVYDQQGYLRWRKVLAAPLLTNIELYPLTGGLFMTQMSVQNNPNKVGMFTFLGELIKEYDVPNKYHHEMVEKTPGGNLLMGTATDGGYEDAIIEVDRQTGNIVKTWDMADYAEESRPVRDFNYQQYVNNGHDWFHLNSVRYDPLDNTLIISARNQNLVCKIGYDDGETKWLLSNHEGWSQAYERHLLTPIGFNTTLHQDQDWTYMQHSAIVLGNGNIMVFDNGAARPGFTNNPAEDLQKILNQQYLSQIYNLYPRDPSGYVRVVEYKVDPKAMTVEKIWEATDFPTISTSIVGSINPLSDDYILVGYGEIKTVSVIHKPTKETVFMGHVDPYMFYRSYPIEFYPEEAIHSKGSLKISSLLGLAICMILALFS